MRGVKCLLVVVYEKLHTPGQFIIQNLHKKGTIYVRIYVMLFVETIVKPKKRRIRMKSIDVIVAALLVIGGINWGLVGFMSFDLVASIFGNGALLARVVYVLVGLSALYQAMQWRAIQRRWMPAASRA
jgi:hypothetical protein